MKYTINYKNSAPQTNYNSNYTESELRSIAKRWNESFEGIDKITSIDLYDGYLLPGCSKRTLMI